MHQLSTTSLTVTFTPSSFEKICAAILMLVSFLLVAIGIRVEFFMPMTHLHCNRTTGYCKVRGEDITGRSWFWNLPIDQIKSTAVRPHGRRKLEWIILRQNGKVTNLGSSTSRDQLKEFYRRTSKDFDNFLHDLSLPSFSVTYESFGGPAGWFYLMLAGIILPLALRWILRWRSQLLFDSVTKKLTISGRSWQRVQTVPLENIRGAELKKGFIWLLFSVVHTVTFILQDIQGKRLFARRRMLTNQVKKDIHDSFQAVDSFLKGNQNLK